MPEDPPKGGPKPPRGARLVVRRDAHRELEYRYDREERLARGTAPRRNGLRRLLPQEPDLPGVLLNVAAAGGRGLRGTAPAASGPGDRARIGPYAARLQALPYESMVYVTLSLRYAWTRRQPAVPRASASPCASCWSPAGSRS